MNNVGRNEPCPCGSGKKYKKCCMNSNVTMLPAPQVPDDIGRGSSSFSISDAGLDIHPYAIVRLVQNPSEQLLQTLSQHDIARLKDKWNIDKVARLETDDIIDRLRVLGIDASCSAYLPLIKNRTSAWSIGEVWATETERPLKMNDEDLICLAACELWKRYCPEGPSDEMVDDWVAEGYDYLEAREEETAIHTWLRVWEHVRTRLEPEMNTFCLVDPIFKITQFFGNWIQDFEMAIANAAHNDSKYAKMGIRIIREVLDHFDGENEGTILNYRCDLGRLLFRDGRAEEGREVLQSVICESPHFSHGYVVLSDELSASHNAHQDIPRAIALLEQALAYPAKDASDWDVKARLADLRKRKQTDC